MIAKRSARRVIKHSKEGRHTGTSIVSSASSEASDTDSKSAAKNAPSMTTRRSRSSRRSSIPKHIKHYVEHNYHDHFHDPPETTNPLPASIDSNDSGLKKRRGHRGGVAVPFPEKLHYMLSRMDQEGTADIVTWQSHGRCFIVHKPKEFVEQIMPSFFKQSKLTSFQRQLNLYGFSRLTAGPDRGGYYHELFIRGRMDLCRRMVRTRVKGNGSKAASSPSTEPNFYSMPPCSDSVHRVISDDIVVQSDGVAIIQDTDIVKGDVSDEEVIGLPMEDIMAADENNLLKAEVVVDVESPAMMTPPQSPRPLRSESLSSSPPPITASSFSFSSLPIVSPPFEPRTLVSPPSSPHLLSSLSIPSCLVKLEDDMIHSGDQMFFEGLPFHYLETKDVEDSLLIDQ